MKFLYLIANDKLDSDSCAFKKKMLNVNSSNKNQKINKLFNKNQ